MNIYNIPEYQVLKELKHQKLDLLEIYKFLKLTFFALYRGNI